MKDEKSMSFFQLAKKGLTDWWLYVITILLTIFGYMLGEMPMYFVLSSKINDDPNLGETELQEFYQTMDFGLFGISTNLGFLLMLMFFVFAIAGLFMGLKFHKKSIKDIITPKAKINYRKIGFGFGFWFLMTAVAELISYIIDPSTYQFHFEASSFLVLLVITLALIPLQTSFEELFFRGYLLQGFGLVFKNKWLPLILTTILFSLVHSANPEIEKYGFWTMQFYYLGAGLFLGIITIMDDSLELALGVHAATNVFGAAIVSYEGSVLQTDTLFKTAVINPWMMTLAFYISGAIFIYVCYKKYKWKSFYTLLDPIHFQPTVKMDYENDEVLDTKVVSEHIVDFNKIKSDLDRKNSINE